MKQMENVGETVKIIIEGEPIPQGRPRSSVRGGRVHVRDTEKSRNYKQIVALTARNQYKGKALENELEVGIDIYRPNQKNVSKKQRKLREDGEVRPIVRPDIDNYIKSVFDGLDGIVWIDDAQVVSLIANKFYSDKPRVEVTIKEL